MDAAKEQSKVNNEDGHTDNGVNDRVPYFSRSDHKRVQGTRRLVCEKCGQRFLLNRQLISHSFQHSKKNSQLRSKPGSSLSNLLYNISLPF